jgi:hypothetical protein
MMSATYRVSKYDPVDEPIEWGIISSDGETRLGLQRFYIDERMEEFDWSVYAEGISARQAVATVRRLEGMSYDRNASILVEKE